MERERVVDWKQIITTTTTTNNKKQSPLSMFFRLGMEVNFPKRNGAPGMRAKSFRILLATENATTMTCLFVLLDPSSSFCSSLYTNTLVHKKITDYYLASSCLLLRFIVVYRRSSCLPIDASSSLLLCINK